MTSKTGQPFTWEFTGVGSETFLTLINGTDETLKSIEILTIFLKDKESQGGAPSQAHIRFESVESIPAKGKAVVSHRTWINGKPADSASDQLERLKVIPGLVKPYVLDISWQDREGKTRFQRIPTGH